MPYLLGNDGIILGAREHFSDDLSAFFRALVNWLPRCRAHLRIRGVAVEIGGIGLLPRAKPETWGFEDHDGVL
jgi:hypothetical protein